MATLEANPIFVVANEVYTSASGGLQIRTPECDVPRYLTPTGASRRPPDRLPDMKVPLLDVAVRLRSAAAAQLNARMFRDLECCVREFEFAVMGPAPHLFGVPNGSGDVSCEA